LYTISAEFLIILKIKVLKNKDVSMSKNNGKVFIISGPSAAGKTVLVTEVLRRLQDSGLDISRIVTCTTRSVRDGEVNGKDYLFVSREDFDKKFKEGQFLETNEYAGQLYGSPQPPEEEIELGKSFFLVVDLEGAKLATKAYKDAVLVWVVPPDMTTLKNRLEKRGSDNEKQVKERLAKAEEEMAEAHKIRLFEYVLVNDVFDQAVEEFILLVKKNF